MLYFSRLVVAVEIRDIKQQHTSKMNQIISFTLFTLSGLLFASSQKDRQISNNFFRLFSRMLLLIIRSFRYFNYFLSNNTNPNLIILILSNYSNYY